jgi:hypothetical protein
VQRWLTQVVEWWPVKQKEQEQKEDVGYYFKLLRLPNQAVLVPQQASSTDRPAKLFPQHFAFWTD